MLLDKILEELSPILGGNLSLNRTKASLTNRQYHLETDNGEYALRVNNADAASLGIDREREIAIIEHVSEQSWSLKALAKSPNYLLTPWIRHETFDYKKSFTQLTSLLKSVHRLNCDKFNFAPLNINQQLEHLIRQLKAPSKDFIACLASYRETYGFPDQLVLCHHDWHEGNIFQTDNQLYLNDWEYAALGDPLVDTVCVIRGFDLSTLEQNRLLNELEVNLNDVRRIFPLVEALSLLWYQVRFPEQNYDKEIQTFLGKWQRQPEQEGN
jgi:thiamine kinase-like enzyme